MDLVVLGVPWQAALEGDEVVVADHPGRDSGPEVGGLGLLGVVGVVARQS